MTLIWSLLPIYLFGNLHCFGMCGPLAMMIGRHQWRYLYFIGRIASFSLAGFLAGYLGFVVQGVLGVYPLGAFLTFVGGLFLILLGLSHLLTLALPQVKWFDKRARKINQSLSYLILKDQPLPTLLFGFFTILLPCGQTLIVFSAIALYESPGAGLFNGFLFSLLTSPSLFLAMRLSTFFSRFKKLSSQIIGITACVVGLIACLRALAERDFIEHFVLSEYFHIVIW